MKSMFTTLALLFSLSAFAQNIVSTKGEELHLTCVINFTPYFILIDRTHTHAEFHLNNRRDSEGRGHSREFIADLYLATSEETASNKELVFAPMIRMQELKSVTVNVPKFMNYYWGKADRPASIELYDGAQLPGSCYVQFKPFPPQW